MAELRTLRLDDWRGGLNLRSDAFNLANNESPSMLNVEVDPRGGFYNRLGSQRYNTTVIPHELNGGMLTPLRLLSWTFGSTRQLMIAGLRSNGANVIFNAFNNTSLTPINTGSSFLGKGIGGSTDPGLLASIWTVWDGATPLVYLPGQRWNGSAATTLTVSGTAAWQESLSTPTGTHMPNCWHVAAHNDRMWCAFTTENGTTYRNRVRFSHPGFPESWRSADYIDVVKGDGGITAIVPFRDALYVFKRNSIHAVYGYDTDSFQLSLIADNIGAIGDPYVAALEGVLYISTSQGVYAHNGETFVNISDPIKPVIENQYAPPTIAAAGRRIWGSAANGESYVYDPSLESWTRRTYNTPGGTTTTVGDVIEHSPDGTTLMILGLMAADRTGWIHRLEMPNRYQDHSGGFLSYVTTRWIDAEQISAKKMWRRPDFVIQQETADTTLTVDVYRDWEESTIRKTFNVTTLADPGAAGSELKRGNNLGLARAVSLKITGPYNQRWGVESIGFKFQMRQIR